MRLFAVAFLLNFVWEMAHMPAYAEMADRPWQATLLRCTRASLVDAILTVGIWIVARRFAAGSASGRLAIAMAVIGALAAVLIESVALRAGAWSYTEDMPRLPLVGVGVWPVLQLMVLPPVALALTLLIGRRRSEALRM